ncbi:hypothetical protein JOQ06_010790, partial [Pogonophryne albipinna]
MWKNVSAAMVTPVLVSCGDISGLAQGHPLPQPAAHRLIPGMYGDRILCTPCLSNHLGAGYGDELLTTAGHPVPHNPRPSLRPPDLLLTHLHGNGAGICFLSCVRCQQAPRHPPPQLHHSSLHPRCLLVSNQKAAGENYM